MKRISILFFFIFSLIFFSAFAETVLWEDENGKVLLDDSGEVNFISADGNNLGSVSSNSLSDFTSPADMSSAAANIPSSYDTPLPRLFLTTKMISPNIRPPPHLSRAISSLFNLRGF